MIRSLLQNGIGIDIEGGHFRAVYVRRQWNRWRAVDHLEIRRFRQLEPSQCGQLYREFLRKHGLKAPQTVVALPRSAVLLRALSFPQTVEKELARAIEYQLDSLHPFEEGSVYWDYAVWKSSEAGLWGNLSANPAESAGARLEVLVGIAEKKGVDEIADWFQEARIPVSQFGITAACLIAMFWPRLQATFPDAPVFFLLNVGEEQAELIGYAPGREPIWQEVPIPPESAPGEDSFLAEVKRELELARSGLRVSPEEQPPLVICGSRAHEASSFSTEDFRFRVVPAEQLVPAAAGGAEGVGLPSGLVSLAAALAASSAKTLLPLNLLPAEKRTYESPLVHLPTYALASLVVILAVALGVRGVFQDWRYSLYLEQQIQALRPQLQEMERTQAKSQKSIERLALLANARNSAALPLEVLNELTRLIPPEVWLQQFAYDGENLTLNGFATAASGLLQTLADSPYFENPQFKSSITRTADGKEVFVIGVRVRAGLPQGVPR